MGIRVREFVTKATIGDTFDRQMVLASIVAPLVVEQDLSRFNIRFQLPMDLKRIEPLSGLAYLAVFCVLEKTLKNYYEGKYRAVTAKKSGMKKRELLEGLKQILGDLAVPLYKSVVVNLFDDDIEGIITNAPSRCDLDRMLFLEMCDFHNFRHRIQDLVLNDSLHTVFNGILL